MLTKRQTTRDAYNPIRDLTMARLVAMEDSAERGQYANLQWFYHHMERSDVTIRSAMSRRVFATGVSLPTAQNLLVVSVFNT